MVLDKIKSLVRKEKDLSLMESHACSEDNISSILDFLDKLLRVVSICAPVASPPACNTRGTR